VTASRQTRILDGSARSESSIKFNLRGDGTNHVEDLEQDSLGDGVVEFTNIERSSRSGSSGLTSGRGGLSGSLTGSGLTTGGRGLGSIGRSQGWGSDVRHFSFVCGNFEVGLG